MRTAIPPITECKTERKQRLRREHDSHQKLRLQMLSLLASGQAHDRQDVAHLLGRHRHTIGRWLARYAARGLHALWETYVPPGNPVSLAPAVLASLEPALRRPEGFASYEALRQWVRQTHGVEVTDQNARHLGARALPGQAQRGATAPHQKTPEALPAFQATCGARLQAVLPPANTRPVRGFSQDERRVGLLTIRRRRLTARGGQPIGAIQHIFEWFYVYGAVEPTTGNRFFLE